MSTIKPPKRPVTIRDIARHLGVHPSSVSRALNPRTSHMVTPELIARVDAAAKELGYRRNRMAYALKTGRSLMVGILVPDIMNPLFPPIIRGLQEVLTEAGYALIETNSDNDADRERLAVEGMRDHAVDGLIFATAHRHDPLIKECFDEGTPIVLVNRAVDDIEINAVVNDDAHGTRLAVQHLADLGHRSIAYIAGPQDLSTGHRRYHSFLATMQELGLPSDLDLVIVTHAFTEGSGYSALATLLQRDKKFSAVIAGNDLLALGCLTLLEERGLRCPVDISVVGFDDMPFMDRLATPLTTIAIQQYEMGVQAGHLFLNQINNPAAGTRTISLAPTLVARKSTASPRAKERAS